MSLYTIGLDDLKIEYCENYDLSKASAFRIGGKATYAVYPKNDDELIKAIFLAESLEMKFVIIGLGSNVLFSDDGFDGAVIFTKKMNDSRVEDNNIIAGCGAKLSVLSSLARDMSLSGLEFAHGIPGTLGGAVVMNAGAYGGEISNILVSSKCLNLISKEVIDLSLDDHKFAYRESIYSNNNTLVCLGATLKLSQGNTDEISNSINKNIESRKASQPLEFPNCGSFFKRPEGYFAAKLIDDAGLKGRSVGGAMVSPKHAGFIINNGGATSKDVLELSSIVENEVYEKFGVMLEREVKYIF